MSDAACFRDHADRYRKLAGAFRDRPISARLATLADECDREARRLPRRRARVVHSDRAAPDRGGVGP